MNYVVKVGEYYVKDVSITQHAGETPATINDILLSKEIMRGFTKKKAEIIAEKINGKVVEIAEEDTVEYEQLSLFDKEVTNA